MATARKINACVGIEISGTQMHCAVLTKNKGFVITEELPEEMLGHEGLFAYEKETSKQFKDFLKRNSIKIKDFSLILGEPTAIVKNIEVGVMPPAAIAKALPIQFENDGAGPDHLYDHAVTGLQKNYAGEVTGMVLLAMSVDSEDLLDQKDIFKWAGVNLHTATCKINALANIIRAYRKFDDELQNDESFGLMEIGKKDTLLHIFKGINFQLTINIGFGVNNIERAISRSLNIEPEQAREHINNQDRVVYDKLEAVLTQYNLMTVEIKKRIAFYNSENFGNHLTEVICMGEGTKIPSMIESIAQTIEIPFDTALNRLSTSMEITGESFDQCITAIGAALQL